MLARTLVFAGGPGEATAFARSRGGGAAGGAGRRAAGPARPGADQRLHARAAASSSGRSARPRCAGEGAGRPDAGRDAGLGGADRQRRPRALHRAGPVRPGRRRSCQRVDTGLLWVVAAFVQEMADDDIGDFWDRTLADAFARGSLFSALSVHLWRGYMLWRRGQLREALHSVRTSNEQSELWGAPAVGVPYGQAFIVGILLATGRPRPRRAAYVDAVAAPGADRRRRPAVRRERRPAARAPRATTQEALARLRAAGRAADRRWCNPVWRPWRTYRAPVLAALGPGRRGARADGRGGGAGRGTGARPASSAGPCGWPASSAARGRPRCCARRTTCCSADGGALRAGLRRAGAGPGDRRRRRSGSGCCGRPWTGPRPAAPRASTARLRRELVAAGAGAAAAVRATC